MFHSRTINNKINRLHERALRIVYSDFKSAFEGVLMKDNSFSIHERNIQSLAIEIYQFFNGLSPSFLNNVFHKNISNSHDLPNNKELYSRNSKTVRCETETVSYMAPKIWSKVPETGFFQTKNTQMETRMRLPPLYNISAPCWFR